jgi:hypothetical protein
VLGQYWNHGERLLAHILNTSLRTSPWVRARYSVKECFPMQKVELSPNSGKTGLLAHIAFLCGQCCGQDAPAMTVVLFQIIKRRKFSGSNMEAVAGNITPAGTLGELDRERRKQVWRTMDMDSIAAPSWPMPSSRVLRAWWSVEAGSPGTLPILASLAIPQRRRTWTCRLFLPRQNRSQDRVSLFLHGTAACCAGVWRTVCASSSR